MASLGGNELITRIKQVARALLSGTAQTDFTHVLQEYHNYDWSNPENYGLNAFFESREWQQRNAQENNVYIPLELL